MKEQIPVVQEQTNKALPIINKTSNGLNFSSAAVNLLKPTDKQYIIIKVMNLEQEESQEERSTDGDIFLIPVKDSIKIVNNNTVKFTTKLQSDTVVTNPIVIDTQYVIFKSTKTKNIQLNKGTRVTSKQLLDFIEDGKYKLSEMSITSHLVEHTIEIDKNNAAAKTASSLEDWKSAVLNLTSNLVETSLKAFKLLKVTNTESEQDNDAEVTEVDYEDAPQTQVQEQE